VGKGRCPRCGERDQDRLAWSDDDWITCDCGTRYNLFGWVEPVRGGQGRSAADVVLAAAGMVIVAVVVAVLYVLLN